YSSDTLMCRTYQNALRWYFIGCVRRIVHYVVTFSQDVTHCKGDVYNFENISLTRDTNICRSYTTATGCDSTYCLHLTFRDTSSVKETQKICEGNSYTFEGQSYSSDTLVCRTYQNALGCDSTRCLNLQVERLTAVGYPQDTILNLGETLRLWVQANATDYTAQWLPASGLNCDTCLAQTVQPVGTSIYEVVLTSSAGCTKVLQFRVEVRENYLIFAPTAFSPNKDGSNDIFKIFVGSSVSEVRSLRIYNRWGDEVYVGEHLTGSEGWNGTWLGKELEQAVYVWWAELVLVNGNVKTISGDVTLLR
ncbi:MAG: gliding motility-associated C-terminal domain-containing protein, partial [Chitinophagaceae bacterium]|nr:gliding motility-associated C-terminal domain-containing protein [Chitinophagaceae bacterium]